MLAMARALMSRPKLLLLDEPSMGLSPIMVEKIFEVIRDGRRARHDRCCWSSRTRDSRCEAADRGYVMDSGLITLTGKAPTCSTTHGARRLSRRSARLGARPSSRSRVAPSATGRTNCVHMH